MKTIKARLTSAFINMPMMGKLFLLIFLAGALPNISLTIFSYAQTRHILIQNTYDSMAMDNLQIANGLESQLESYRQVSSLIFTDVRLKNYLLADYKKDYDFVLAYQYIDSTMYRLLATNSNISNITIFIPNRSMPEDGKFIKHLDNNSYGPVDWLISNENSYGNILYHAAYTNEKGERVFSLGRALNYNNQNFAYGYLTIEIKEASIFSELPSNPGHTKIYITNENGIIMAANDGSSLGEKLPGGLAEPVNSDFQAPDYTEFLRNEGNIIANTSTKDGWRVVKIVNVGDILEGVGGITRRIVVISAVCFLVTFILMLVISRYFSSRVNFLNRQIRLIEEKDLLNGEELHGKDELGQLSLAINRMARKLDVAIHEVYENEIQRKKAQLTLLQSQINPHFLYNTLSGISTLAMRKNVDEVSSLLNHLSQFYKTSLNQGREYITIKEEIALTNHYLALQDMRFPRQFNVIWDIDDSLTDYMTLKLILQPFVENIINHAQREDGLPVIIGIAVKKIDEVIQYILSDNGAGIPPEKLQYIQTDSSSVGYGIWNANSRIKLAYGEQYGVYITSAVGVGTKIVVQFPLQLRTNITWSIRPISS